MKVPTAEKFFDTNYNGDIVEFAKEFAKIHVEEALKKAKTTIEMKNLADYSNEELIRELKSRGFVTGLMVSTIDVDRVNQFEISNQENKQQ